jgi:hypothetical protein
VDNKSITSTQEGISGLWARLHLIPGTLQLTVRGSVAPRPPNPDARRGEIHRLSRSALNRFTAFTRELQALEHAPGHLLTLTYPGNWRGSLSSNEAAILRFRTHWERLEDLRAKITKARQSLPYNRDADWVLKYLLDEFRAERYATRKTLAELRRLGPNGRKVKEHLKALIKRFDRRFGTQVHSLHQDYNQALQAAQELTASGRFVQVKVRISGREDWKWEVVSVLYRLTWWLEFQRRGAPHLHIIFFDVREGLDWQQVRAWVGAAWAAVVAGLRNAKNHDPAHNPRLKALLGKYDQERTLWNRAVADAALRQGVEAQGLDWGVFQHVRAGTRLEKMRKEHWGYAAKEASKYASKKYQAQVPKNYRNVGRWWGYSKYERHAKYWLRVEATPDNITRITQAAVATLPQNCFRFRQKTERFLQAVSSGEPYGYLTVWGQAAVEAALGVL